MKKLLVKCIETFFIYLFIYLFKILKDVIFINLILENPFHIKVFNILHEIFYQSHV